MLDEVAAARREIAPMIDRADILSQLIYEGHDRLPAGERAALQREFDAIWAHIQALHGGDVYWEERQVLYAAHGALLRAGTIDDLHTRRLVSAAAGVLADGPGPLATADCIRCPNHFASAAGGCRHRPGSCRALADPPQDGARTPLSQAARHAAALLAMAARVPWGGDEQWTCCADLIDQALAAARCGLSAARST